MDHYSGAGEGELKRVKTDEDKTMFIRNFPLSFQEQEVVNLVIQFSPIKILLLRNKGQAFVEFKDPYSYQNAIRYFSLNSVVPAQTGVAIQALPSKSGNLREGAKEIGFDGKVVGVTSLTECRIVKIIIAQSPYPINVATLHAATSKFGKVLRVLTFAKNGVLNGLVEFETPQQAASAQVALDGQYLWAGGQGYLSVAFSPEREQVQVNEQTEFSWDFTKGPMQTSQGPIGGDATSAVPSHGVSHTAVPYNAGITITPNTGGVPNVQMHHPTNPMMGVAPHLHQPQGYPGGITPFGGGHQGLAQQPFGGPAQPSAVSSGMNAVYIQGINKDKVNADLLFNVFGYYGNIRRLKIMTKERSNGLVEYYTPEEAKTAMMYLNGQTLFGSMLKVSPSKLPAVHVTAGAWSDTERDVSGGKEKLNRYPEGVNSLRFKRVSPPTSLLHIILTDKRDIDESVLRPMFEQCGQIEGFERVPQKGMCFVRMVDTESALNAMAVLHNTDHIAGTYLRISFTHAKGGAGLNDNNNNPNPNNNTSNTNSNNNINNMNNNHDENDDE